MENTKTKIVIENQISGLEIAIDGLRRAAENGNVGLMSFYSGMITRYTKEIAQRVKDNKKGEI